MSKKFMCSDSNRRPREMCFYFCWVSHVTNFIFFFLFYPVHAHFNTLSMYHDKTGCLFFNPSPSHLFPSYLFPSSHKWKTIHFSNQWKKKMEEDAWWGIRGRNINNSEQDRWEEWIDAAHMKRGQKVLEIRQWKESNGLLRETRALESMSGESCEWSYANRRGLGTPQKQMREEPSHWALHFSLKQSPVALKR